MTYFTDYANQEMFETTNQTINPGALNANGALAQSSARAMDTITTCGASNVIMAVMTIFSVCVSFYLLRQLITLLKEGIKSSQELKGAINDAMDRKD